MIWQNDDGRVSRKRFRIPASPYFTLVLILRVLARRQLKGLKSYPIYAVEAALEGPLFHEVTGQAVLVAWVGVCGGGWRRRRRRGCTDAGQTREEGRDFERHLVTRRGDSDRSRLHHFRLVVPGIDLHASAQGQSSDLIELSIVERRAQRSQGGQAIDCSRFRQWVAEVRGEQRLQLRSLLLQCLQEQAHVIELLCVGRVLKKIDSLLVG